MLGQNIQSSIVSRRSGGAPFSTQSAQMLSLREVSLANLGCRFLLKPDVSHVAVGRQESPSLCLRLAAEMSAGVFDCDRAGVRPR